MILVVIPYWKSKSTLKETVDSILNQSYQDFHLLIINDGDPESPSTFIDPHPRITFFDMKKNHGRYFVDAVAVMANPYEFYLPIDADDVSHRDRLKILLQIQSRTKAEAVFNYQQVVSRNGRVYIERYPLLNRPQTSEMKHLAHHSALYKTEVLKSVGSYHPDFRVGYDTLLVNLIRMKSKCSMVGKVLHVRKIRDNSLTTSPNTGFSSNHRKQATRKLRLLYKKCWDNPDNIQDIISKSINKSTMKQVIKESKKLKKEMKW